MFTSSLVACKIIFLLSNRIVMIYHGAGTYHDIAMGSKTERSVAQEGDSFNFLVS